MPAGVTILCPLVWLSLALWEKTLCLNDYQHRIHFLCMPLTEAGDRRGDKIRLKINKTYPNSNLIYLAYSKSLLNCLFQAQILENKSSQLLGITHNLLHNLFFSSGTFYLSICNSIVKMKSFSSSVNLFSIHYVPRMVRWGQSGDKT